MQFPFDHLDDRPNFGVTVNADHERVRGQSDVINQDAEYVLTRSLYEEEVSDSVLCVSQGNIGS